MCAPSTPWRTAFTLASIFGIIPPEIVPSAMSASMFFKVKRWYSSVLSLFMTPSTSVKEISLYALRATASSPAIVSALMFKSFPFLSRASGETTGMYPASSIVSKSCGLISRMSPTYPKSTSISWSPTCTFLRPVFSAMTNPPSFPEIPTPFAPFLAIIETMVLLILPARTIWAISKVSLSVTRRPPTNFGSFPTAFIFSVISGPPPCTRTTRMPT